MNVFDGIAIGLCLLGTWWGWRKGVYKALATLLSLVIAIWMSTTWASSVAVLIAKNSKIDEGLHSLLVTKTGIHTIEKHLATLDRWIAAAETLPENVQLATLVEQATTFVLVAISGFLLFSFAWFFSKWILGRVAKILDALPLLKLINRLGGATFGAVTTVMGVLAVTSLLHLLVGDSSVAWLRSVPQSWIVQSVFPALGLGWSYVFADAWNWLRPLLFATPLRSE